MTTAIRRTATFVDEPLAVDFLCGRTTVSLNHPGTIFVKGQCSAHVGTYIHAEKPTKETINAQIVLQVYARGGRFLSKDEQTEGWFSLNFVRARQRVSAIFRNLNISRQMKLQQRQQQQQQRPMDTIVVVDSRVLQEGNSLEEFPEDRPNAPWGDSVSLPRSILSNPMSVESCLRGTSMAGSSISAMDTATDEGCPTQQQVPSRRPQHVSCCDRDAVSMRVEQKETTANETATRNEEKEETFSDISTDGPADEAVHSPDPRGILPASQNISPKYASVMTLVGRIKTCGRSDHSLLDCFRAISEQVLLTGACREAGVLSACMDSVAEAMNNHSQNSQIQRYGCLAMARMTCGPSSCRVNGSTTLRSLDAVVSAIRSYRCNEEVQGYGMWALGNFAKLEPRSDYVLQQLVDRGLEVVVVAMQRHSSIRDNTGRSSAFVQRYGCYALSRLAASSHTSQRTMFETEGFAVILDAMRDHLTDEDLQTSGCEALALLLRFSLLIDNPRSVLTAAKAAMEEYPRNRQIQVHGNEIRQALDLHSNPRLSSLKISAKAKEEPSQIVEGRPPRPNQKKIALDEMTRATETTATLTTLSDAKSITEESVLSSSQGALEKSLCRSTADSKDQRSVQNRSVRDAHGDGGVYTGDMSRSSGLPHGYGKMVYNEGGRSYEGNWRQGRWHRRGSASKLAIRMSSIANTCVESVESHKNHHFDVAAFSNGDSYEGEYRNGARHGRGSYTWKDGRVYEGSFINDKRHGSGVCKWPNGAVYDGEYFEGCREGHGHFTFPNKSGYYLGSWIGDEFEGYGVCQREDGRFYAGQWKVGRKDGPGVEISKRGEVQHDGEWRNGHPVISR